MVEPISLILFGVLLSTSVAITFWDQVLLFFQSSILPWINKNLPQLSSIASEALRTLDKVAVTVRRAIKNAWQKLRSWLLKSIIKFSKKTSSVWVKEITSFLIKSFENGSPQIVKRVEEESVAWDSLPDDVREQFLRSNRSTHEEDFTAKRDEILQVY